MSADLIPYSGIVLGVDAARVDPAAMAFVAGVGRTAQPIELLTVIPIGSPSTCSRRRSSRSPVSPA